MRDTARFLSEVRTSSVMVQGVADLREMYGPLLAEGTFDELLDRTTILRDRIEQRVMEDPEIVPRVVSSLERARGRYETWPIDPDARSVYGIGIRHDYRAIGPGLKATHARGRHQMVTAYQTPSPESFHRWRKRVKYLRHQMEILTPLWPEVMIGMAVTLDRISELLGQDHDLAELLQTLADRPDLCPNPMERSLIGALAEQRRADLQTASRILGRRIYAEAPSALAVRVSAYWESMELRQEDTAGLAIRLTCLRNRRAVVRSSHERRRSRPGGVGLEAGSGDARRRDDRRHHGTPPGLGGPVLTRPTTSRPMKSAPSSSVRPVRSSGPPAGETPPNMR